jgi:RimJ/RimL family protein N-acetyltransferase
MLEGHTVLLRPVKREDIRLLLKWYNDPEVTQYIARYLPTTETAAANWIEELARTKSNTDVAFVVEAGIAGLEEAIGDCGLTQIDHRNQRAELSVVIGQKHLWGKGYGTEAARLLIEYGFGELSLHRVTSLVLEFNERSIMLHRKLGFREEGRVRQSVFKRGRFWDTVVFGLLKEELPEANY